MELHQSPLYKDYIERIGWKVISVSGTNIYIRQFPFIGSLAKIQRPDTLPDVHALYKALEVYHVRIVSVEPKASEDTEKFSRWVSELSGFFRISRDFYLPTKTIHITLSASEKTIFSKLTEAKRRAVRRAEKNNVYVEESSDIAALIRIKNKSSGLFGSITTTGLRQLWGVFSPGNATILLSYAENHQLVGGVLLVFWNGFAYYWIAGATREGKQLFAPTLLVWEAIRLSKKRNATWFDFVGVWDERLPKQNKEWLGFTKFKEGFGGTPVYYPIATLRK